MDVEVPFAAAVAETHSGVVSTLSDRAYKLKKQVDLGFLDFRNRDARLDACRREVALNRRLAPDVYLGIADINGTDARPCDHLVVMRRMPDNRRLSSRIAAGTMSRGTSPAWPYCSPVSTQRRAPLIHRRDGKL